MKPLPIAPLALAAVLGACANSGADIRPVLDGTPSASFQSDLSACRQLARAQSQLDRGTMATAAVGAGIGGVLGGADDEGDALGGAVVGALAGAAAGASEASDAREAIVKDCLRGRGHPVVG
jgi:uncharacterized protein YcfJ